MLAPAWAVTSGLVPDIHPRISHLPSGFHSRGPTEIIPNCGRPFNLRATQRNQFLLLLPSFSWSKSTATRPELIAHAAYSA